MVGTCCRQLELWPMDNWKFMRGQKKDLRQKTDSVFYQSQNME